MPDPPRKHRAGRHAQHTATRLAIGAQLILASAIALAYVVLVYAPAPAQPYGLVAAGMLALVSRDRGRVARRWHYGAAGERDVARALRRLPRAWTVVHDVDRGRGNVDHIAVGPTGIFTIETKLHRRGARELTQAREHAAWCAKRTGQPVTAVLCTARATQRPKQYAGVWVCGPKHLPRLLRSHRHHAYGPGVDVAAVTARLTR